MTPYIYLITLRRGWKSLATWFVCLTLFMIMMASLYPSIASTGELDLLIENIEGIRNIIPDADFGTPQGWLNTEVFSVMLPIMAIVIAVGAGSSLLSKDEEDGTIELLLSRSVPRWRIALEHLAVIETRLIVICVAAFTGSWLGTIFVPTFDIEVVNIFWTSFGLLLFGLPFGYLSYAITAWGKPRALATGISTATFIIMYFVNSFSQSIDWLKHLKPYSLTNYFESLAMLNNGPIWENYMLLALIAVVFGLVSIIGIGNRDI